MPEPYWSCDDITLYLGDCLGVMRTLPDNSVDAIVTDPPAAVSFMGRSWDGDRGGRRQWVEWLAGCMAEALRVLKPGGHALVWSLPRTSHWTAWAVEDAGLEIRDCVLHVFGSGFPKSRNVGKAIDKRPGVASHAEFAVHLAERREAAGLSRADVSERVVGTRTGACWNWEHHQWPEAKWWPALRDLLSLDDRWGVVIAEAEREVIGTRTTGIGAGRGTVAIIGATANRDITAPATEDAARWDGWGTALKPGQEMWWLARKPLVGSVAGNVLAWGTGALNIDATRVGTDTITQHGRNDSPNTSMSGRNYAEPGGRAWEGGRWPSNVVFSHSAGCVPAGTRRVRNRSGSVSPDVPSLPVDAVYGERERVGWRAHGDADGLEEVELWSCVDSCPVAELDRQSGVRTSGSRKAGTYGLMDYMGADAAPMPEVHGDTGGASRYYPTFRYTAKAPASERPRLEDGSAHETVKSLTLARWLCRLVTPPGGTILDMFCGSGVIGESAIVEGFRAILIDQDRKSADLTVKRLAKPIQPCLLFDD